MSETTSTTVAVVDENARVRAFTALALGLAALWGGGVFAATFQWLVIKADNDIGSDQLYAAGVSGGPLVMGLVALSLAIPTRSSDDQLARPLARAAVTISAVAIVGSVLLMMVTVGNV